MQECLATCLHIAQGDENNCFVCPHYNLTPYKTFQLKSSLNSTVVMCTGLVSQAVTGFE